MLGAPKAVIGATIVALGSQLPDVVASIAMARRGHAEAALSNAIGSQVITISLGAGLPFLFYNVVQGKPIHIQMDNVSEVGVCLLLIILLFCLCLASGTKGRICPPPKSLELTIPASYMLLLGYTLAMLAVVSDDISLGN